MAFTAERSPFDSDNVPKTPFGRANLGSKVWRGTRLGFNTHLVQEIAFARQDAARRVEPRQRAAGRPGEEATLVVHQGMEVVFPEDPARLLVLPSACRGGVVLVVPDEFVPVRTNLLVLEAEGVSDLVADLADAAERFERDVASDFRPPETAREASTRSGHEADARLGTGILHEVEVARVVPVLDRGEDLVAQDRVELDRLRNAVGVRNRRRPDLVGDRLVPGRAADGGRGDQEVPGHQLHLSELQDGSRAADQGDLEAVAVHPERASEISGDGEEAGS